MRNGAGSGLRVFFNPEIDALIRELRRLSGRHARFDPFGKELGDLMVRARDDPSLWPALHEGLTARRAELLDG